MGIQGVPVALNNIYKLTKLINFDKIINEKFNSGDIYRIDIKGDKLWVEKI